MNIDWHDDALGQLLANRDQLHHALLIEGQAGIGKHAFACALAAALLCEAPRADGRACGHCLACGWFSQQNHPDFRHIQPESQDPDFVARKDSKPSRHIRIEQIRTIAAFVNIGAHRGGRKLILIEPAEAMNVVAANGLLKTLEEPPGNTVFMLVCAHPDALSATIRSRCRRIPLRAPTPAAARDWLVGQTGASAEDATRWLAAAGGSPFAAMVLAEPGGAAAHRIAVDTLGLLPETSAVEAAERLIKVDARDWLPVVQAWISDLARVRAGASPRFLPEQAVRMGILAGRLSLDAVLALAADIARMAGMVEHPLNPRLYAEGVLLRYCEAFRS